MVSVIFGPNMYGFCDFLNLKYVWFLGCLVQICMVSEMFGTNVYGFWDVWQYPNVIFKEKKHGKSQGNCYSAHSGMLTAEVVELK